MSDWYSAVNFQWFKIFFRYDPSWTLMTQAGIPLGKVSFHQYQGNRTGYCDILTCA